MCFLILKRCWLMVICMIVFSLNPVAAEDSFYFTATNQDLTVSTSKRLNYGVVTKQDFDRADYNALFPNTHMIDRQQEFFDLSKLGTGESLTATKTQLPLSSIGYGGGSVEYLLYTEFDRMSKPAVFNYITAGSLAIGALSSTDTGKKIANGAEKVLDELEKISETASVTVNVVEKCNKTLKAIYDLAELPQGHEYRRLSSSIDGAIAAVNGGLGQFNEILGAKKPTKSIDTLYAEARDYTGFQGGTAGSKAIWRHLWKLFTDDISNTGTHLKSIVTNRTLEATLVEVMVETILEPFALDGKFYYPKSGNQITPLSKISDPANNSQFESIEIERLARNITRYSKGDRLGDYPNSTNQIAAKRQIALASKAIFAAGGQKLILRMKNLNKELGSYQEAVKLATTLYNKAVNVSANDLYKFGQHLVTSAAESLQEIGPELMRKISIRLASYAVPAAGWGKAAIDLASVANSGGAFAYDIFTAPRQVPFVIYDDNGTIKADRPFSPNFKKYSFLRYPSGVNTFDPFSNGEYSYSSYFITGNVPTDPPGSYIPWNINNHDASLVANGVTYSYNIVAGAGDKTGFDGIKQIFNNSDKFPNGLYSLDFSVLKYPNDNLSSNPVVFTSPITGVENSESLTVNLTSNASYKVKRFDMGAHANFDIVCDSGDRQYSDCTNTPIGYDSYIDTVAQKEIYGNFYYLSYKDFFVAALAAKYGSTFSQNYLADRGIMQASAGIYSINTGLAINAPTGLRVTQPIRFADKHMMFVMASVGNGDKQTKVYNDPNHIPYIGTPLQGGGVDRYFEYDLATDRYNFVFSFDDTNFKRKTRIALFNKTGTDFSDFFFYTLDPAVDLPDSSGHYRITVPSNYFDGLSTMTTLRLAWYDAVVSSYCEFTGADESAIVQDFFARNKIPGEAIRKVFVVQDLFGSMADTTTGSTVLTTGTDTPAGGQDSQEPYLEIKLSVTDRATAAWNESDRSFSAQKDEDITLTPRNGLNVDSVKNGAYLLAFVFKNNDSLAIKIPVAYSAATNSFSLKAPEAARYSITQIGAKNSSADLTYVGSVPFYKYLQMLLGADNLLTAAPLATPQGTVILPRTGQYSCYDTDGNLISCAGTGQDGEIQAGAVWPAPRFVDNANGSVTDKLTGLMWTKDANLLKTRDSGFDKDGVSGDGALNWIHALDYVSNLNVEGYLGHNDWRLPNYYELISLYGHKDFGGIIWLTGVFSNFQAPGYWSSTTYAIPGLAYDGVSQYDTTKAWGADLNNGIFGYVYKTDFGFVWPVRDAQAGVVNIPATGQQISYYEGDDGDLKKGVVWNSTTRFSDNGGNAFDNLTGLLWLGNVSGPPIPASCNTSVSKSFSEALEFVSCINTNNYRGYNDWRLPNINELISIADLTKPESSYDAFYWSSTSHWFDQSYARVFDPIDMTVDFSHKSVHFNVLPVRGGYINPVKISQPLNSVSIISENLPDNSYQVGATTKAWRFKSGSNAITGLKAVRVSADPDLGISLSTITNIGPSHNGNIPANSEFLVYLPINPLHGTSTTKASYWKFVDGSGADIPIANSTTSQFWLKLKNNRPPVFSQLQRNSMVGQTGVSLSLPILASDPDGDTLTYSISIDNGAWQVLTTNVFQNTFAVAKTYQVAIKVDDGHGEIIQETVKAIVSSDSSITKNFFSDVHYDGASGNVAKDQYLAIQYLTLKGITIGYPDPADVNNSARIFKPAQTATQAEALAMVMKAAAIMNFITLDAEPRDLPNLAGTAWVAPYVLKAEELGMIGSADNFDPSKDATRAWLANVVSAMLKLDTPLDIINPVDYSFPDSITFDPSGNGYNAARSMAYFGYMGTLGQNFNPNAPAQRGDVAMVASRVLLTPTLNSIATAGLTPQTLFGMSLPSINHGQSFTVTGLNGLASRRISELPLNSGIVVDDVSSPGSHVKITVIRVGTGVAAQDLLVSSLATAPVTIPTNPPDIRSAEIRNLLVLVEDTSSHVRTVSRLDYGVLFPDRDGDGVRDDLDKWPDNPFYAHDANNNGLPDNADAYWGLTNRNGSEIVTVNGQQMTLINALLQGKIYFLVIPNDPIIFATTAVSQNGFTANWYAVPGTTEYHIDLATDSAFASILSVYNNKNISNVTSYALTGLAVNTPYYYRIRAYNSFGSSNNSSTINQATLVAVPTQPVATAASAVTQTGFTANWNALSGVSEYHLDVASDSVFTNFITGYNNKNVGNTTSASVSGLVANTTYYYRVRAYNAGGSSSNSVSISQKTLIAVPPQPTATAATAITRTGFTANWNAVAGATGYCLDVASDSGFTNFVSGYNNKNIGNITSSTVTGLSANSTYYYRLRAYNAGGPSSNSNSISQLTLPQPSNNLLLNSDFESGHVGWTETSSTGMANYLIYNSASNGAGSSNWYAYLAGDNSLTEQLSQNVSLPANAQSIMLDFDYLITTGETTTSEVWDTMKVIAYDQPTGLQIAELDSYSNLSKVAAWTKSKTYDLLPYKGRSVKLAFVSNTDTSLPTTFKLDNVRVIATVPSTLTLTFAGTGSGSVNSNPSGIACSKGSSAGCSAVFPADSTVTLMPSSDSVSTFDGWSACSGTGNCDVSMALWESVEATFTAAPKAMIGTKGFSSLALAYADVPNGGTATMMLLGTDLGEETLTVNNDKKITLSGGHNVTFTSKGAIPTLLKGALTISSGSLTVDGLQIK